MLADAFKTVKKRWRFPTLTITSAAWIKPKYAVTSDSIWTTALAHHNSTADAVPQKTRACGVMSSTYIRGAEGEATDGAASLTGCFVLDGRRVRG